jgi:hypothetical protein
MQAWLDSQTAYRLALEKAKEAANGATYAAEQVEKLNAALAEAKKRLAEVEAQTEEERNGLLDERRLIQSLMDRVGAPPMPPSFPNLVSSHRALTIPSARV